MLRRQFNFYLSLTKDRTDIMVITYTTSTGSYYDQTVIKR